MTPLVLDASVGVALVHAEPQSAVVKGAIGRWRRERRRLIVPSYFWLELLNALGRGHRYGSAALLESLRELDEVGLETVAVERSMQVLAADLIERFGLTSYDAAYLAVAQTMDAGLVTLGRSLAAAAAGRWVDPAGGPEPRPSETRSPYGGGVSPSWPGWSGAGAYLADLRARALAGERS
jgi:predicted nucleic acid-binding protein